MLIIMSLREWKLTVFCCGGEMTLMAHRGEDNSPIQQCGQAVHID